MIAARNESREKGLHVKAVPYIELVNLQFSNPVVLQVALHSFQLHTLVQLQ